MWQSMPVIPELWKWRQEDYQFKVKLNNIVRYYLKKKKV
jgi:hypothetical protein